MNIIQTPSLLHRYFCIKMPRIVHHSIEETFLYTLIYRRTKSRMTIMCETSLYQEAP